MADDDATIWGPNATAAPDAWASPAPVVDLEPAPPPPPPGKGRTTAIVAGVLVAAVALGAAGVVAITRMGDDKKGGDVTSKPKTDEKPSAVARFAAIPAATTGAGSAHIRTTETAFEDGQKITTTVTGLVAFTGGAFDITASIDGIPPGLGGLGVTDLAKGERVFSDGTTAWAPLGPLATMTDGFGPGMTKAQKAKATTLLQGKKYLASPIHPPTSTDPSDDASDSGDEISGFTSSSGSFGFGLGDSTDQILTYLRSVSGDVQETGTEQGADGATLIRYQAAVDLDTLQRNLPAEDRDFDGYDFKAGIPHTFPTTVLVDAQGRLRSLDYTIDLGALLTPEALANDHTVSDCPALDPALLAKAMKGNKAALRALDTSGDKCVDRPARPEELVTTGSIQLSDYGTPVTITPPPAAEVLNQSDLSGFFATLYGGPSEKLATVGSAVDSAPPTSRP